MLLFWVISLVSGLQSGFYLIQESKTGGCLYVNKSRPRPDYYDGYFVTTSNCGGKSTPETRFYWNNSLSRWIYPNGKINFCLNVFKSNHTQNTEVGVGQSNLCQQPHYSSFNWIVKQYDTGSYVIQDGYYYKLYLQLNRQGQTAFVSDQPTIVNISLASLDEPIQ